MNKKVKEEILNELEERIADAHNVDEYDVKFALENFKEFLQEIFNK
jgi:hypothetical protein